MSRRDEFVLSQAEVMRIAVAVARVVGCGHRVVTGIRPEAADKVITCPACGEMRWRPKKLVSDEA